MATKSGPGDTPQNAARTGHPSATPAELLALADEYGKAAEMLESLARSGAPHSRAPFRLAAIHAIELYLSAFLLSAGQTHETLRSHGHNLAARSAIATPLGLVLRQKTVTHLAKLTDTREYLMSRYRAEASDLSQPNRLAATLREVRRKVVSKLSGSVR